MEMEPVRSEAIAAVGYDPQTMQMAIRFTSGDRTYTYFGVPQSVYDAFMSAPSMGHYFDSYIRDRYGA